MTDDRIGELNNHYIPKFIMNHFGESISCYNVRTGDLLVGRSPASVFCEKGLYTDDVEKMLNERIEQKFSKKLWSLLEKDEISLHRKDVWIIKRFLAIEALRTPDTPDFIHKFRENLRQMCRDNPDSAEMLCGTHVSDVGSDESDTCYWMRTIETLLEMDEFTTTAVDSNPRGTALAHYFTLAFTAGYLGFWDADSMDEFVITDVGMTSETEVGAIEGGEYGIRKMEAMLHIAASTPPELERESAYCRIMIGWLMTFHENFYMFPISSRRMIVLINPFFKFMLTNRFLFPGLGLEHFTLLNDERLFAPNRSTCNYDGEHLDSDTYTYTPTPLSAFQTRYCNALFMDRVDTWLGFGSLERIKGSAETYREMANLHPRNNYTALYHILSNTK